jgi:anti-anti-sigma factor
MAMTRVTTITQPGETHAKHAMSIQRWSERIWIVKLGDGLGLSEELSQLVDELSRQCEPSLPDIVLDMAGVSHLTSSNLSALLRLRKVISARKAHLRVVAVNDSVWSEFLTMGLDGLFSMLADVSTALAALQIREG